MKRLMHRNYAASIPGRMRARVERQIRKELRMRPDLLQIKMNRVKAPPKYHQFLHNKIGLIKTLDSLTR